ncbi:MAG: OmpA family protein [Ferruginibacter sp.]
MDTVRPFTGTKGFRKWSVGLNVGGVTPANAFGGKNDFSNPKFNIGAGLNLRYQFSHIFALQADGFYGQLKANQDDKLGNGQPATGRAVLSHSTNLLGGSLSGVVNFGNINWISKQTMVVPYVQIGAGMSSYKVKVVRFGTTNEVDYNPNSIHELYGLAGGGLRIGKGGLATFDLGYRMHWVDGDNLDGYNSPAASQDKFSYAYVGVEFSLGKKTRPQLQFNNPVYIQNQMLINEINAVKAMIDEKDTDGDGVADKWDREPNTPPNCPVDAHGVSKDTDGDGVIDCKDKQLITPTECQPVDADGVGKCPDPACCSAMAHMMDSASMPKQSTCNIGDLPSISFKGSSKVLTANAKAMLASVAAKLKNNPTCNISVTSYPAASKPSQNLCNQRLEVIKRYLVEKENISADRIATNCEVGGGDENTVDIKGATM